MHDREGDTDSPNIGSEPNHPPKRFVLETTYRGERKVVAQGVAFLDPEQVVINWRANSSVELVGSVDEMYQKFGNTPRVLWLTESGILTEAEPDEVVSA